MFFLNDGHFERHLGFLAKIQGDSPGLFVCCSTDFSVPILNISACYEKCPGFPNVPGLQLDSIDVGPCSYQHPRIEDLSSSAQEAVHK